MTLGKVLLGATLGAGPLTVTTMSASAAVVCNGNVCWHVHESYDYRQLPAWSFMKTRGRRVQA
jgi:hypothetical protein